MVDKKIVEYVAQLARVAINEDEKKYLSLELSKILDYIDTLKHLDISAVEPLRGFHLEHNAFREDHSKPHPSRDDILKNAPSREGDYFKVPKVIE